MLHLSGVIKVNVMLIFCVSYFVKCPIFSPIFSCSSNFFLSFCVQIFLFSYFLEPMQCLTPALAIGEIFVYHYCLIL